LLGDQENLQDRDHTDHTDHTGGRARSLRGPARGPGPAAFAAVAAAAALCAGAVPAQPDPVPLLRAARAHLDSGASAEAISQLAQLEATALADHAGLLRARLLREVGRIDDAVAAAEAGLAAEPPSELRALLKQELARSALAKGELASAYRLQRAGWEISKQPQLPPSLAMELAREFELRGMPADALRLYRRVWRTWPRSAEGRTAFERSAILAEGTGVAAADPKDVLEFADGLRKSYRCDSALPVYERQIALDGAPEKLQRRAERGRAQCLFQRRRYEEARVAWDALAKQNPKDLDAATRAARSLARGGHTTESVKRLEAIAKRAGPATRARVHYLIAVIARESEPERSSTLLKQVEKQRSARSYARLARWRLAWDDYRNERYTAALRRLRPLAQGSSWGVEQQRARYWIGMAKLQIDPPQGEAALREILEAVPLSYYGLLAAERLGVEPELEHSFVGEREREQFPAEVRAGWLVEGGFPESANAEIESWLRASPPSREERLAAAPLLHEIGEHHRAVRLLVDGFGSSFEEGIDPEWREAWQHAWPRAFGEPVRAATREFEFDPDLVSCRSFRRPDRASRPRSASRGSSRSPCSTPIRTSASAPGT
jgi:tetratricopeptide (TPR) repeat protein